MTDTWQALERECGACHACALADTRTNVVFGDGATDAEILLVGEGPGQREDEQGVPFVGPAGKLLDDMLEIIGLDRTKVYVANIVKCRPPRNRDPLNVEQDACIGWLRRQTALLRPKIIVCLGRIAAKAIIREDFKITAEHGKWFERGGVQMTAIYHPSALLRDADKRPETFTDLKAIQRASWSVAWTASTVQEGSAGSWAWSSRCTARRCLRTGCSGWRTTGAVRDTPHSCASVSGMRRRRTGPDPGGSGFDVGTRWRPRSGERTSVPMQRSRRLLDDRSPCRQSTPLCE